MFPHCGLRAIFIRRRYIILRQTLVANKKAPRFIREALVVFAQTETIFNRRKVLHRCSRHRRQCTPYSSILALQYRNRYILLFPLPYSFELKCG
ncbi:MAG: hypothetical protein COZ49_01400 [Candidatus Yonathbacteria bacterium CG_4_10_14_3_um_filter_47_65]|uniref:Uncharacterized protein n=1 Tax=Candidatus Yonathbacteria bacterium CG_4_9_14_0_8_um_filter_46_47 TaxID=1975106 RepID=A0A2M8D710_9BACT|nr:MAG: hypothetical protein COW61_04475 [Candidatus Yonathbacteria bacterium CG17_big_fil_post_rev_8_21_14_2_50_46_19]PIX56619.1 MAG: hypothetical protein COZ49_01400 [Candidatus Yonathbacteria bacterium CG_4_10_14_3_um_filter_47_65]PIY57253.1 MAG: hypothetical protein COY99_04155 [Candidatus Yonathbacteria bacterium CG_4_10_14_0_8_um_filter_47_645]PJB82813.1 MAG: hypothetical protein CO088_02830 [Candidatus Yonathbacteria bacterium CG_4_9_14_0_8_um_filter_46_47]PJC19618.1 MAG: hypothetical pr